MKPPSAAQMVSVANPLTLRDVAGETVAAEKTACLLCGSPTEAILTGVFDTRLGIPGNYEIRQCDRCGLEQTWPVSSLTTLKQLYETHYNFGGEKDTRYTRWREQFLFSFFYRLWTRLDGDAGFFQRRGTGRLLDVGCNEGRGLRMYAHGGFHAEGLDLNENAAAVARQAGFTVHTSQLTEFYPAVPYNVVVLSNVLEHTLDPRQMLIEVGRVLAKDGKVWISCPNSESWLRAVFGRLWINWHVPFHITHFGKRTLSQLLGETGFKPIEIRYISPASWVAQSLLATFFAKEGRKNQQLRNPFWVGVFMIFTRFVLFPVLWLGNKRGRGDCLVVVASKI
jgi:2-polyprenyl-3-methyl-5-hydroxy-6-metoxy-1,4-benzoquinol methylase